MSSRTRKLLQASHLASIASTTVIVADEHGTKHPICAMIVITPTWWTDNINGVDLRKCVINLVSLLFHGRADNIKGVHLRTYMSNYAGLRAKQSIYVGFTGFDIQIRILEERLSICP